MQSVPENNKNQPTFYWHDYETWGARPLIDRPAQFAGMRTTLDFQPVGRPLTIYAQPTPDFLPDPEAVLITGITPQYALNQGVNEANFAQAIVQEMSQPNTIIIGYNNIRFDDEVTRSLCYRNFYDPYAHTWQNGNSRWDLIDVVRACYALRPEGINWPEDADGRVTLRLEKLTQANRIDHGQAHDAMSDVRATIAMAQLIAEKQPKLWQFALQHRHKNDLMNLINWQQIKPLVHVSGLYGADNFFVSAVLPIGFHAQRANALIAWDLRINPADFADYSTEQLRDLLFASRQQHETNGTQRPGATQITLNRCPFLAPLATLTAEAQQRTQIDLTTLNERTQWLVQNSDFRDRIMTIFDNSAEDRSEKPALDVDQRLYDGFFDAQDKQNLQMIRSMKPEQLAGVELNTQDNRLPELLFRYRARNYPATLDQNELQRWQQFCRQRLTEPSNGQLSITEFAEKLEGLAQQYQDNKHRMQLLKSLYDYAQGL